MKRELLIATNNQGKVKEMEALLGGLGLTLLTPKGLGLELEVAEVGSTYQENAALKAQAFLQSSGLPSLADDSGLEVDALDGAPGLYSARFSPLPKATDRDRRVYLHSVLKGKPAPWGARFRCWVALAIPGEPLRFAEGVCEGEIISEERGDHGFGYDPIFLVQGMERTMAQLERDEKNRLSHRARAVMAIRPVLESWLKGL